MTTTWRELSEDAREDWVKRRFIATSDARIQIIQRISEERLRQLRKFGDQSSNHTMRWCAILGEEFGEVCAAALDSSPGTLTGEATLDDLKKELVQVAAVAVAWLEQLVADAA